MPFPNFPGKYNSEPVLKAADLMALRQQRGKQIILDAQSLILCFQPGLLAHGVKRYGGHRVHGFLGEVYLLNRTKPPVVLAGNFGIGAPGVAALIEEMAVVGIRRCIATGIAGALQPGLMPGDVVIPSDAIRDEGTSYHYLSPEQAAMPSPILFARLTATLDRQGTNFHSGQVWTTDAPYRETAAEIHHYQTRGVLAVEMEAAALFAVSTCLGIEAASTLVISDSLAEGRWKPANDGRVVTGAMHMLLDVCIEVLTA
jgi:uridine phosphorylase